MSKFILSVDQGTSSSRAILFHENGGVHSVAQKPLDLSYPQEGWVEQNPQDLVNNSVWAVNEILRADDVHVSDIAGMGITNQRETTIVWDRKTGEPIYNAIVWQDRRTSEYCATLKRDGHEDMVRQKTGLLLDPYFSATKIKWILDNVEGARARAENGDLLFGTVDCYLLWHFTNGRIHATDSTNASRTLLYNIIGHNWDETLLQLFDIPSNMLPKVLDNISDYSQYKLDDNSSISILSVAGDQQSASIGQGCVAPGLMKATYGTGCFALMNVGAEFVLSDHRLLTTIACSLDGDVTYALEGSIFNAGTAIQFLRDNLSLFDHAHDTAEIAQSVPDNNGVYFVPAFTGLGAPYWNPSARAVLCGMGRDTSKAHIVRAALEAQAYQTRDLLDVMEKDSGAHCEILRVDGGLVANEFMCQFLSNLLGATIEVPRVSESTAWGVACLTGVGAGLYSDLADASSRWKLGESYLPKVGAGDMDKYYRQWQSAVEKTYT